MARPGQRLLRLRSLLLGFALLLLLIPLGSLYLFRMFENELVLRTELELIAQSAALGALYRQQLLEMAGEVGEPLGLPLASVEGGCDAYYQPIRPVLDLADGGPLPPRTEAVATALQANPLVLRVGERLQPVLRDTQQVTLAGMRVLDWQGIVIAGRDELGQSLAQVEEVAAALQGRYAASIRQRISDEPPPALSSISRGTGIRLFTAYPVRHEDRLLGVIYLSRTPENILRVLYQQQGRVIWPALLILGLALLLAGLLAALIVRPLGRLMRQTEQVAGGDGGLVEPIVHPGSYEVARLSESFARMANALNQRARYIEQFAAQVSHEFKTPLTAMQGALELLLEHDDMPWEQRRRFLDNLLADTQRLRALVGGLLELARADNLQAGQETAALAPILDELRQGYGPRGLAVKWSPALSDLRLRIAPSALRTVIDNLLRNSLEQGADRVEIGLEARDANRARLAIKDNGQGISPPNRERVFTPFFTTRRGQGGTGLGLGIVRSLLKGYQGAIELGEGSAGAVFLVSCRLAN